MANDTYGRLAREALLERLNLGLLAAGAGATGLGLAPWHPVAAAIVGSTMGTLELGWVLGAPLLPGYRRLLRERAEARLVLQRERQSRKLARALTPELETRYEQLRRLRDEVRVSAREAGSVAADLLAEELDKLDALLDAFLRLLTTWLRYRRYLNRTDENAIVKDIAHLRGKVERTTDPDTRRIITQNLEILEKRRERIEAIQKDYLNMQAQLEVIEDTFQLVNDQMVAMRMPGNHRIDLGKIIAGVETTEAVLQETRAFVIEDTVA